MIEDALIQTIFKYGVEKTAQKYGLDLKDLKKLLEELIEKNISIQEEEKASCLQRKKQLLQLQKNTITHPTLGIIADTYLGCEKENKDYIKRAYETFYKAGITDVFVFGDLLNKTKEERKSAGSGILHALERFPKELKCFPKDFQTYCLLGERNFLLQNAGIDIRAILSSTNKNMHLLDYMETYIKWQERILKLQDRISKEEKTSKKRANALLPNDLALVGGGHYFNYVSEEQTLKLPTCSNFIQSSPKSMYTPGFVILENNEQWITSYQYGFRNGEAQYIKKRRLKKQDTDITSEKEGKNE